MSTLNLLGIAGVDIPWYELGVLGPEARFRVRGGTVAVCRLVSD